jgi:predicted metal-dependent hydrolase
VDRVAADRASDEPERIERAPVEPTRIKRATAARGVDGHRPGRGATVMQGDRAKAYRPISSDLRRLALEAGLQAYERGDFFEAHELLEPAWMGAADLAERALYQGLIKLAAGYVHAVRGNPIGVARNLHGARAHLDNALRLDRDVGAQAGIDVTLLLVRLDARLRALSDVADELAAGRGPLIDLLPEAPAVR